MGKLHFVDGYHGGIRGHMPEGSWQDILHALEVYPSWKISLEIEPESWDYIRIHDLRTYCKLQNFVSDPNTSDRIEFISGSYAQPFCWAVNGESNIRQLIHGVDVTKRHFSEIVVDTYAVQEPCFTSSLPQILKQLGYNRMSLKNPTAWGGYMTKMPGEIINLYSHDGSSIPTVPRYECEELIRCNATEASGYDFSSIEAFAEKCHLNGITAPAGMCLQDLGWSSKPLVQNMDVEYVTWREYFRRFSTLINGNVEFSQEDVLVALPWGNRILQEMLRNVRNAENRILQTEKLLSIAEVQNGDMEKCRLVLEEAWEMLMQAQHHDGYICATTGEGTNMWAFRSNTLAIGCCSLLDNISDIAKEAISGKQSVDIRQEQDIWLRVYNTIGNPRESQAEVTLGLEYGARSLKVYDENNIEVPSQFESTRSYADGTIGTAILRFEAKADGIGYCTYHVVPSGLPSIEESMMAKKTVQNTIEVTTDFFHVVFDLTKGGSIVRLFDKETKRDYVAGISEFGTLRAYSVPEDMFINNSDTPVECEIISNGSIYTELSFTGRFNDIEFQNVVKFRLHDRRIDFETSADFKDETEIGYPYEPKPEEAFLGTKRSSCREDYKLGVQFPLGEKAIKVMKSAPFDLYESRLNDTRFDSWETIQHNILNGYADFYQACTNTGLTIFCDHVNGYSLVDNHFSLTLGFGYHGNFWWGNQPLKGKCKMRYSILPHAFDVEQAQIPYEDSLLREPLLVQLLSAKPDQNNLTVFCCENKLIEAVTILRSNGQFQVRLFHGSQREAKLSFKNTLQGFRGVSADLRGEQNEKATECIDKLEIKTLI